MDNKITIYFETQKRIHEYFGYKEDWVVIPMSDERDKYWHYSGDEKRGKVSFSELPLTDEVLESGNYYSAILYTQRFLPKWIYRTDEHTMICVDTQCDGNKFLMIFSNELEIKHLMGNQKELLEQWS